MSRFNIDWSKKDERLKKLYAEGMSYKDMEEALGLSRGALSNRIKLLGLKR